MVVECEGARVDSDVGHDRIYLTSAGDGRRLGWVDRRDHVLHDVPDDPEAGAAAAELRGRR